MKKLLSILIVLVVMVPFVQAANNSKPNIVFIFADDLGWGDLSCYGNERIQTPRLDKLATQGTLFTRFYVNAPVCSPSRAGIMTGQFPSENRIYAYFASHKLNVDRNMPDHLDPDLTTLTDLLKQSGYRTGHFGKWHLGRDMSAAEYGVDEYCSDGESTVPGKDRLDIWSAEARPVSTKRVMDETLDFIKRNQDKPFYVNAWLADTHATLNPSEEQLNVEGVKKYKFPPSSYIGMEQVYYACLVEMDKQIGIFLDKLDALGLADNTIVIFSSDNGPEDNFTRNAAHSGAGSSGPFRGRKRSLYEGGVRVPFIVRWPGQVPAGRIDDQTLMSGVDFIPTLCKLTNTPLPKQLRLSGEDVSDMLLGKPRPRTKPIFWERRIDIRGHILHKSPRISVMDNEWKLLLNPDNSRVELYHIPNDPSELTNLASAFPDLTKQLSKLALDWYNNLPEAYVHPDAGKSDYPWPGK